MKIVAPCLLLLLFMQAAKGQVVVSSLYEDFNITCEDAGPNYPTGWTQYNVIEPKALLAWNCAPLSGRYSTPGMACSGFYGGRYFKDTAWLFTPLLNLRDVNERIFFRYDSRYQFIAAKLSVMISYDYDPDLAPDRPGVDWIDLTTALTPVISQEDSVDWVTHWVDVTPYKEIPFYVAFRYVSDTLSGGIWTIDNVMTTVFGVNVKDVNKRDINISVLGMSTRESIALSATVNRSGNYTVNIYDNIGRLVHQSDINLQSGTERYTLNQLNLKSGMYLIKLSNGAQYGVVKTVIP